MVIPNWYKASHPVQAVYVTDENVRKVEDWIAANSKFSVKPCFNNHHIHIVNQQGGKVIRKNVWVVIDNAGEVSTYSIEQFNRLYYELSQRKVEDVDL